MCYHDKTVRVYNVAQNAGGPVGQDSCQENSCISIKHIKPTNSQDSFLKRVRENDQKKKEAKRKVVAFKCQPAPPRRALFRTSEKEPELLESIPLNSWQDRCLKKKRHLDCKKRKNCL